MRAGGLVKYKIDSDFLVGYYHKDFHLCNGMLKSSTYSTQELCSTY